ncbi:arginase family protein [Actinoplanes sp. M2I2]|uniref:arginase family protein n=1 Tax=Actinoplanes sp. M2I2 TaxID=1734444 RepID=UPI002021283B|nr:arginase family protein [Actinoplanes sp. M2I2]
MWFLLGAPWDCSGTGRGEERAPDALREAGLSRLVDADLGDAATAITSTERDPATGVRALPQTMAAARALAAALGTGRADRPRHRPLVVGGDCSLLLGVFAHLRAAVGDVGLWMADGHPDYVDPADSDTGETADSELAVLTGLGPAALTGLAGTTPMVDAGRVSLIGHRTTGLDPASAAELARVPAGMLTLDADPGRPMWLHLDVDVLDPSVMPAVTYPQPGGPGFEQLEARLRPLAAAPDLIGVSIADYRPDLDPDGVHAAALVRLLGRLLAPA